MEYEHNALVLRLIELLHNEQFRISINVHGCESDEQATKLASELFDLTDNGEFIERGSRRKRLTSGFVASTKAQMVNGPKFDIGFYGPHRDEVIVVGIKKS